MLFDREVQRTAGRPLQLSVRRSDVRTGPGPPEKAPFDEYGKHDAACAVVDSPQPLCLRLSEDQAGHLDILTRDSPKQCPRRSRRCVQDGSVLNRISQHELSNAKGGPAARNPGSYLSLEEGNDFRERIAVRERSPCRSRFNEK
jgi:hypothetical protein